MEKRDRRSPRCISSRGRRPPLKFVRAGSDAHLQFVLPAANANGAGPSVLDRVQIYAVTVPPGYPGATEP